jgi:hypothetical protein
MTPSPARRAPLFAPAACIAAAFTALATGPLAGVVTAVGCLAVALVAGATARSFRSAAQVIATVPGPSVDVPQQRDARVSWLVDTGLVDV